MLPSQGYFKTFDCPFYKNNLCHRVYCHFRHVKNNVAISPETSVVDDNAETINTSNSDFMQPVIDNGIQNVTNTNDILSKGRKTLTEKTRQTEKQKIFLPLDDIPHYNPTPLSELETRSRHINCENVEKTIKLVTTDSTKRKKPIGLDDCKRSDLAKDLVDYILQNDELCELVSHKISKFRNESSNNNQLFDSQRFPTDHKELENYSNEIVDSGPESNKNIKHFKSNKTNSPSENDSSQYQSAAEDVAIKQETCIFRGKEFSTHKDTYNKDNSTNKRKISKTEIKNTSVKDCNNCNRYLVHSKKNCNHECTVKHKHKPLRHKHSKTKMHTSSKMYNNSLKETNCHKKQKFDKSKREILWTCNEVEKENHTEKEKQFEVIIISDSEDTDYDEFDEILQNVPVLDKLNHSDSLESEKKLDIYSEEYDEFSEILKSIQEVPNLNSPKDLPEPKKKIRISRVKTNTVQLNSKQNLQLDKMKIISSNSVKDNDFPQPKKKIRKANVKAEKNTITIKSTEEYISYWERVKDRVKNKCRNSSCEEGYQNWSKVKISPVLNVTSLLNSKKLLYAKINQYKSGKN